MVDVDRWYAKHLWPRYVPVKPAKLWKDLLLGDEDGDDKNGSIDDDDDGCGSFSSSPRIKTKKENYCSYDEDCVRSIPFEFLVTGRDEDGNAPPNTATAATSSNSTSTSSSSSRHHQEEAKDNNNKEETILSKYLVSILDKHGFLVVSNALNDEDCSKAIDLAWDWIEAASVSEYHISGVGANSKTIDDDDDDDGCCSSHNKDEKEATAVAETTDKPASSSQQQLLLQSLHPPSPPPVSRDDPSTLLSEYFPKAVEGGIQPFYGSGHSSLAWYIRSHPNIIKVFEALQNTNNLLSSLDGIVLWRSQKPITDIGWFHLDQNPLLKPYHCRGMYQALVNLLPVSSTTGGNAFVTQSHHLFPHHYLQHQKPSSSSSSSSKLFYQQRLDEVGNDDWLEIDPTDETIFGHQSSNNNIVSLLLDAGDVLIWDSRLVHCSYPGKQQQQDQQDGNDDDDDDDTRIVGTCNNTTATANGLIRAVTLVTMVAANDATTTTTTTAAAAAAAAVHHGDSTTTTSSQLLPPPVGISREVLQERRQSTVRCRTLTNWIDKVVPLGEERPEQVALEQRRVAIMKNYWQQRSNNYYNMTTTTGGGSSRKAKVLLEWEDLTETQRRLVVGNNNSFL